jgi:hypothetical protein
VEAVFCTLDGQEAGKGDIGDVRHTASLPGMRGQSIL